MGKAIFQSTPPARGATYSCALRLFSSVFQSTPPARGATSGKVKITAASPNFNPRPPRGGRRGT